MLPNWATTQAQGEFFAGWLTEYAPVSYTHLRAHETVLDLVCRLLLEKRAINVAPAGINNPRIAIVNRIPIISTNCCFSLGTFNLDKIITNTKILSIESAYSVSQPAKNSPCA